MILVDTSVIIDYLKGTENCTTEKPKGSRNEAEFNKLKVYLGTLDFYELTNGHLSYEKAAYINFLCRRSGVTIRSTVDLLIVQTAIEHGIPLLHNDSIFDRIAGVVRELVIYR